MVTTASIRLALMKLARVSTGVESGLISVLVASTTQPRHYVALVPMTCRSALYRYLNEQLGFETPPENAPLALTAEQAAAVVALAMVSQAVAA